MTDDVQFITLLTSAFLELTRFDVQYAVEKFSEFGVCKKVPEGSTLISYQNFLLTLSRIGERKVPYQNQLDSIERQLLTNTDTARQTARQTDTRP